MSHDQAQPLFAIMRAAADGQIIPDVAEYVAEEVCHQEHPQKAIRNCKATAIRFTGNHVAHMLPPEELD